MATHGLASLSAMAATEAHSAPSRNWPCAPMLNRPPLKPMPTARPARISGVALTSVLTIEFSEPTDPCQQRLVGGDRQEQVEAADQRAGQDHQHRAEDQRQADRDGRQQGDVQDAAAQRRRAGAAAVTKRPPASAAGVRRRVRRSPSAGRRPRGRRSRPSSTATSCPRNMTPIRSDISSTSSSSAETSRMAMPAVAPGDGLAMDELDAAHVQAARRLVEDQQLQLALELAGHHHLLLVAAGQGAGADIGRWRAHVVLLDRLPGVGLDRRVIAAQPARIRAGGSSR